jgi:hypothetical protein
MLVEMQLQFSKEALGKSNAESGRKEKVETTWQAFLLNKE